MINNPENNYIDSKDNKLEVGFYKSCGSDRLIEFTGKYDSNGLPIFSKEESFMFGDEALSTNSVRKLEKINIENVKKELTYLKVKTNWIEEKINEVEFAELISKIK